MNAEDPTKPFVTTVLINGVEYGKGAFLNKKQSKHIAAEKTLELLSPGLWKSKSEEKSTPKVAPLSKAFILYLL